MKQLVVVLIFSNFIFGSPPRSIPPELYLEFTMNGEIPVSSFYRDDSYPFSRPAVYDFLSIEILKQKAVNRETNYYGMTDLFVYEALDSYKEHIQGKKIAVMGSVEPWYEAVILAYGGYPITIEYNRIISEHPDVQTRTVSEFDANPEEFDAVLSISSFEHDGLGRYGDPINPRGDLIAMEKAKNMLKPGGILILAVPVGKDLLAWNAHRVYGEKRLPLLLNGWKVLAAFGFEGFDLKEDFNQPVFVLEVDAHRS